MEKNVNSTGLFLKKKLALFYFYFSFYLDIRDLYQLK